MLHPGRMVQGGTDPDASGGATAATDPDEPALDLDFSVRANIAAYVAAGYLATARTGGTLYADVADPAVATSVAVVADNTPVWMTLGWLDRREADPYAVGGGILCCESYSNAIAAPFDFTTGWTKDATVTRTASSANGPDGSSLTATKLDDTSAGAQAALYRGQAALAYYTLYAKNNGAGPSADGCLAMDLTPTDKTQLQSGANWRRVALEASTTPSLPTNFGIFPSTTAGTGAIDVWGAQYVTGGTRGGKFPLPLMVGTTTMPVNSMGAAGKAAVLAAYNEARVIDWKWRHRLLAHARNYWETANTRYCIGGGNLTTEGGGSAITADLTVEMGTDAASNQRCFVVRWNGIELLTTGALGTGTYDLESRASWFPGDELSCRLLIDGSTIRLHIQIGALVVADATVARYFPRVSAVNNVYFGSNGSTAGSSMMSICTGFTAYDSQRDWHYIDDFDVVLIGDSTIGHSTDMPHMGTSLLRTSEARAGFRILGLAKTGDTMALQLAKVKQSPALRTSLANFGVAIIKVTVNDIAAGTSAATITADIQSCNDVLRNAGWYTIICHPDPVDGWSLMAAGDQAIYVTVRQNLAGTGPNPVTNASLITSSLADAISIAGALAAAGSNLPQTKYDRAASYGWRNTAGGGDHVHFTPEARGDVQVPLLRTELANAGLAITP